MAVLTTFTSFSSNSGYFLSKTFFLAVNLVPPNKRAINEENVFNSENDHVGG